MVLSWFLSNLKVGSRILLPIIKIYKSRYKIDRKGYSYFRFAAGLPFLLTKSGGENPSNWHPVLIATSMPVTLYGQHATGTGAPWLDRVWLKGSHGVVPRQTPERNGSACCCHLMKMEKCKQGKPEIGKRVSGLYVDFNRRDVSQLAKCIDSSSSVFELSGLRPLSEKGRKTRGFLI